MVRHAPPRTSLEFVLNGVAINENPGVHTGSLIVYVKPTKTISNYFKLVLNRWLKHITNYLKRFLLQNPE